MAASSPPAYPGPPMDSSVVAVPAQQAAPEPQIKTVVPAPAVAAPQYAVSAPQTVHTVQTQAPILTQTVVVQPGLGEVPGETKCQHCQQIVVTQIQRSPGFRAWSLCLILGVFGIWPCCLIPLFMESCQDVKHHCPNCQNVVHIFRRY